MIIHPIKEVRRAIPPPKSDLSWPDFPQLPVVPPAPRQQLPGLGIHIRRMNDIPPTSFVADFSHENDETLSQKKTQPNE